MQKYIIILFICVNCFVSNFLQVKEVYPDETTPWNMPIWTEYRRHSDLWNISGKDDYASVTDLEWHIYSAMNEIPLYKSKQANSKHNSTEYLEKFTVFDYDNQSKLVFIKNDAKHGWAPIKNFILLPHALKTDCSIDEKAVLITKVDDPEISKGVDEVEDNKNDKSISQSIRKSMTKVKILKAYKSPITLIPTKKTIKFLEFCFIYKYYSHTNDTQKPDFALIGTQPFFNLQDSGEMPNQINDIMLGWISMKHIINWNTRQAFQPNPKAQHPIYYFNNIQDIAAYYKKHPEDDKKPTCQDIPSCKDNADKNFLPIQPQMKVDKKPWPPKMPRFVILEEFADSFPDYFKIGIPTTKANIATINGIIENMSQQALARDIVFLIDATQSMTRYLELTGKIVKDFISDINNSKDDFRFGVAYYRDYKSKADCFKIMTKLISNVDTIELNLMNIKAKSEEENYLISLGEKLKKKLISKEMYEKQKNDYINSKDYFHEAVFQGLKNCITSMNWRTNSRKLIIHIGDTGDHKTGKENISESDIASMLVDFNVDNNKLFDIAYAPIQLFSNKKSEYPAENIAKKSFSDQSRKIIDLVIEKILSDTDDKLIFSKENRQKVRDFYSDYNSEPSLSCKDEALNKNNQISVSNHICKSCGKGRWIFSCINSEDNYQEVIREQIRKLIHEVNQAQSIYFSYITGVEHTMQDIRTNKNNFSYEPQLMPGIVKSLMYKIGKAHFDNKNLMNATKETILKKGGELLKSYQKSPAYFYTTCYVAQKHPDYHKKKKVNANAKSQPQPQLNKVLLFRKTELYDLYMIFEGIKSLNFYFNEQTIKTIYATLLRVTIGQPQTSFDIDKQYFLGKSLKEYSFRSLIEKQYGIILRSEHPLLSIEYQHIESNLENYSDSEKKELFDKLRPYFEKVHSELHRNYHDSNIYFKHFGVEYAWINSSILP